MAHYKTAREASIEEAYPPFIVQVCAKVTQSRPGGNKRVEKVSSALESQCDLVTGIRMKTRPAAQPLLHCVVLVSQIST